MEKQVIFQNDREIKEAKRDFLDCQADVNAFLAECKKCKLQINSIPELITLINNPRPESNLQYLNSIKEEDIPSAGDLKMSKDEFFKTLELPNLDKLVGMAIRLQSRVNRIDLGTLSKDKLTWDQVKFDKYKDGLIVKSDSILAAKILNIANATGALYDYLLKVAEEKNINKSITQNLGHQVPYMIRQTGHKFFVDVEYFKSLENAIK